ncbi:unnamed protein product [Adineta ricciae]|uniref:G-protein coupled receptors family 1 profile domain-containing protein n=1 Tax=Adineta ricciae TaxID=249248 RepID=A0A815DRK9_ADIRI|nr:unnamed protein product [Adineta ricciae]CAF1301977.1 unnamed protein product [Adineta ricciae]
MNTTSVTHSLALMATNATTSFLVIHLASIQTQITRCLAIPLVLGIFGNSASCMVFSQKQLRSSGVSRFFIAASTFNIIVLIYGVGTSFFALDHVSPDTYSLTFCKLRLYLRHILLMIVRSYIILACIASFAISSPHTSLRALCQPRYVNWAIVLVPPVWPLIAIHMIFFNTIQKNQCVNIESYVIPFGIYFFLVVGLLPVVLMTIFISLTTRNLRRLHHRVRASVLRPTRLQSRDRHFIRMLQGLVVMYAVTNLFYPANVLYSAATHWTAKSAERTAIEAIIFSITSNYILYINNVSPFFVFFTASDSFRHSFYHTIYKFIRYVISKRNQIQPAVITIEPSAHNRT